jgi:S1-C subfamily serine protease
MGVKKMKRIKKWFYTLFILSTASIPLMSQELMQESQQIISKEGYEKSAPAVVKIVSDEGKRIGAGVILAVHTDGVGFLLTSYRMIAGRDKVAVILRNYPEPLLGYTVDKWIDFDTDLAIVAIKDFPPGQPVITLGASKSAQIGETLTIIGHIEGKDWMAIPVDLIESNERRFALEPMEYTGFVGGPLLNADGDMIGLVVTGDEEGTEEDHLTLAVKSEVIKPIIKKWFKPIDLQQKWREKRGGFATWVWAVGGGVLGGTIVTAIAVAGGGDEGPRGLPRPPNPPPTGN